MCTLDACIRSRLYERKGLLWPRVTCTCLVYGENEDYKASEFSSTSHKQFDLKLYRILPSDMYEM